MAAIQNTNRITGMFSGMDTDALVKAMAMGQQTKVDKLNQKKQQAEWKKDQLTDLNNKLRIFKETYGSVMGEKSLIARKTFSSFNVDIADNAGVRITALATAKNGSHNIRVDQIATAASMFGTKITNRTTGLTDQELNAGIGTLTGLAIGDAPNGNIEFSINGVDFSFTGSDSLKKIMDTVNKSKAGVTMSYLQATDRIDIVSNTMGEYDALAETPNAAKTITFTDTSGFLGRFGLNTVVNGQDAIVYVDGEQIARRVDSNTLTLDGIQMNFVRATGEEGVDYTLSADYKPAVETIKKFVEEFNALIKELYDAYSQKADKDYIPLTDEMREAMSEKEIEKWEEKAKEGLLNRDATLGKLVDTMRGILTKTFGDFGKLSSIGLNTSKYLVGESVQLEIDEEKLLAALESNADQVYGMLGMAGTDDSDGGLMQQMNKAMDSYIADIKSRDIQNLTQSITDYTKSIKEQEDKLEEVTEKYYLKYAKLETAMSKMQAQQSQMSSMFGGGTQS
ncbi:MAG: flagellar filament capping protein FliD [Oscillospiraceae bacterium]|jgi:flagellar hook-associated protein 2|nr:flagellar filament capping protein FliD [Oscillospiraceae bacterium]